MYTLSCLRLGEEKVTGEPKRIKVSPRSRLVVALREAAGWRKPLLVDTGEAIYALSVDRLANVHPTLAQTEVARSREGILKAAGGWRGIVEAEGFKVYIRERRRTANRPSVRL